MPLECILCRWQLGLNLRRAMSADRSFWEKSKPTESALPDRIAPSEEALHVLCKHCLLTCMPCQLPEAPLSGAFVTATGQTQ